MYTGRVIVSNEKAKILRNVRRRSSVLFQIFLFILSLICSYIYIGISMLTRDPSDIAFLYINRFYSIMYIIIISR